MGGIIIGQIKKDEQPINNEITVSELIVIGPNGEKMGRKELKDALTLAQYAGLDLVLVSGNADVAVGKIMDYNKYKYEKQKKLKEQKKKQRESMKEMKEFQLSATIDVGDFAVRVKNAREYLIKGHKIKSSIRFKGREMAHTEIGSEMLYKFAKELEDVAEIEQKPVLEGRNMSMILAPKKK